MFADLVRNITSRCFTREIGISFSTQSLNKAVKTNSTSIFSGSAVAATIPLADLMIPIAVSNPELENHESLLVPLIEVTYLEQQELYIDELEENDDDWN